MCYHWPLPFWKVLCYKSCLDLRLSRLQIFSDYSCLQYTVCGHRSSVHLTAKSNCLWFWRITYPSVYIARFFFKNCFPLLSLIQPSLNLGSLSPYLVRMVHDIFLAICPIQLCLETGAASRRMNEKERTKKVGGWVAKETRLWLLQRCLWTSRILFWALYHFSGEIICGIDLYDL